MKAGKLDRRISIVRIEAGGVDEDGYPIPAAPVEIARPWAEVLKPSAREYFKEQWSFLEGSVIFRIRWLPGGVQVTDFVDWEGRRYQVREVAPIGRREGLELRCKEYAPEL